MEELLTGTFMYKSTSFTVDKFNESYFYKINFNGNIYMNSTNSVRDAIVYAEEEIDRRLSQLEELHKNDKEPDDKKRNFNI